MIRSFFKRVFSPTDPLNLEDGTNEDWAPVQEINSPPDVASWLMIDEPAPVQSRRRKTSLGRKFLPPLPITQLSEDDLVLLDENMIEEPLEPTPIKRAAKKSSVIISKSAQPSDTSAVYEEKIDSRKLIADMAEHLTDEELRIILKQIG